MSRFARLAAWVAVAVVVAIGISLILDTSLGTTILAVLVGS